MRLDLFLVTNNFFESRNKAAAAITAGNVLVDGKRIVKASYSVLPESDIEIISDEKMYVARSAAKLLTAIDKFSLNFKDLVVSDFGSSTGGFCEVLLDCGAKLVYAVDIGQNQLHPKIKSDKRVINKEHTNARYLSAADFDNPIDFITCDLSFISLKLILNAVMCTLKEHGEAVCLVKPQFEVGSENVGKNGVVRDLNFHIEAIKQISQYAFELGFEVCDVAFSGLAGESGNREYVLYLKKSGFPCNLSAEKIYSAVKGGN